MKKTIVVNQYLLPVSVVPDGDGFLASCPDWSDCYAQGDSIDEAISEIMGVAGTLIELYREESKRILVASSLVSRVSKAAEPLLSCCISCSPGLPNFFDESVFE